MREATATYKNKYMATYRLISQADDLSFAKEVTENRGEAVDYFLTVFSKPLLEYIGRKILRLPPVEIFHPEGHAFTELSYSVGCSSLYYKFIAEAFPADKHYVPQWDKLRYYVSDNRSRLATYLSVITTRYFLSHHPDTFDDVGDEERRLRGERRTPKSREAEILHSYDESERLYLLLCLKLQDKDEEVRFSEEMYQELNVARGMLKDKYAKTVEYCYFTDMTTTEISERMRDYFETSPEKLSRKDVQTRISQWKNRALASLTTIILNDSNRKLFPHMRAFISNH